MASLIRCRATLGAAVAAWTLACAFPKMEVVPLDSDSAGNSGVASGGTAAESESASGAVAAQGGSLTIGASASTGGTSAAAGTNGVTVGSGCTGGLEAIVAANGLCAAKTVLVPGPSGNASYGIDITEVTRSQYEAWLATNPAPPSKADVSCSANSSYATASTCMASSQVCKTSCGDHPVVCVDWCDAQAYCAAVGKRLCGKIGGGTNAFADQANENASQWYRACSAAAANVYPYSNTYSASACNGNEHWTGSTSNTTVPVGSLTTCQSPATGFGGIFDMSGNVVEWEDSCASTGAASSCRLRGGAFEDNGNTLACGYAFSYVRTTTNLRVGFRCCSL